MAGDDYEEAFRVIFGYYVCVAMLIGGVGVAAVLRVLRWALE